MHTVIATAVHHYEVKYCEYLEFLSELRDTYGEGFEKRNIGGPSEVELRNWKIRLEAMEEVLGLSETEVRETRLRAEAKSVPFVKRQQVFSSD